MSADLDLARDVIGRLGRASQFLSDPERLDELQLGCEVAKETLLRGAQHLVAPSGRRPMMTSKRCDGTPIIVVHREIRRQPGGQQVRSQGRQCVEFLVQNQFLRCDMNGVQMVGRPRSSSPNRHHCGGVNLSLPFWQPRAGIGGHCASSAMWAVLSSITAGTD